MTKKMLLAGMVALMAASASAQEVKVYDNGRKWSPQFDVAVSNAAHSNARSAAVKEDTVNTIITTAVDAAEAVASRIASDGFEAEAITGQCVVANIATGYIETLAADDDVLYINNSRTFYPTLSNARKDIGADKVQAGTNLDTPYDGTGVIIGVIDQGFEFKHIAFSGRVKKWGANGTSGSLQNSAPSKDAYDDVGHATHVSNIAMGNKIDGVDYYGIATGAELVPMMSNFSEYSVLSQAKAIKKYAEGLGMPWVINMSFGAICGPHDGSTEYEQSMSQLTGTGGILVGAMGNEGGDNLHATHTFTADGEKAYFCVKLDAKDNENSAILTCCWGREKDTNGLTIKPVLYQGGKLYEVTSANLQKSQFSSYASGVDKFNGRTYYDIQGSLETLAKNVIGSNANNYLFFWQVEGKAGQTVDVWTDVSNAPSSIEAVTRTVSATGEVISSVKGDEFYSVGEGAASIPEAIAVASYNTANNFYSLQDNRSYSVESSIGAVNDLSKFSSKGPSLNADFPDKPTIAAPGGCITSAFSKKSSQFDDYKSWLVKSVTSSGNKFYYGVMSGTSMATPVVTGTIALWLQANPSLTPADIRAILKKTARHDSYTTSEWSNLWGYGKLDAYEGLKEAINLRTGIDEAINTATPVSLSKGADEWKVLFNSDESFADIRIVSASGQTVANRHVDSPRHGDEQVISLTSLTPGVYLFNVTTAASSVTRKMVVK